MSAADVTTEAARPAAGGARARSARPWPRGNPWRHPWFLEGFTWLYLIWSLVPIGIAVLFSFNNGRSQAVWQGFSWRWYFTDPLNSVLHDPNLHAAVLQTIRLSVYTTLICVPLGVAFALGINRWRGAVSASANFAMILSFVIPELIFGNFAPFSYLLGACSPTVSRHRCGPGVPAVFPLSSSGLDYSRSDPSTKKRRWTWAARRARHYGACSSPCSPPRSWQASPWSSPTRSTTS
jgi:hypothetical protein